MRAVDLSGPPPGGTRSPGLVFLRSRFRWPPGGTRPCTVQTGRPRQDGDSQPTGIAFRCARRPRHCHRTTQQEPILGHADEGHEVRRRELMQSCRSSVRTKPSVRRGSLRSWGRRSRQPLRANDGGTVRPSAQPALSPFGLHARSAISAILRNVATCSGECPESLRVIRCLPVVWQCGEGRRLISLEGGSVRHSLDHEGA
jgi:hypothetical protein